MKKVLFSVTLALLILCIPVVADTAYIVEFTDQPIVERIASGMLMQQAVATTTESHTRAMQQVAKLVPERKHEYKATFNGFAATLSDEQVAQLEQLPTVKAVHLDSKVHTLLADSIPQIYADDVWPLLHNGINLTGHGITIAILDTGIDYTHPDLGGCLGAGCKVAGGFDVINNDADPMDDNGHGTHVAATAAGNGFLKGVAPDATLYGYKVLGAGGFGFGSGIMEGIERATDPNGDGDTSDHLDIISMSLGGSGHQDDPLSRAVDNAVAAGVVAVVAAGNSGPGEGTILSPGTARDAITVGAINKHDAIAPFSSRGPFIIEGKAIMKPDLTAPGVNICAAQFDEYKNDVLCLDDAHIAISGTSMATPHVAGAAALVLQAHDWSPMEVKMALRSTTDQLLASWHDVGSGKLNVHSAVTLSTAPSIATIVTGGDIEDVVPIIGTATGREFVSYTLSVGVGNDPLVWEELITATTPVQDDTLFTLDTASLQGGDTYTLRLQTTGASGHVSEARNIILVDNIRLKSVLLNDIFRSGALVPLTGAINGNPRSVTIEYGEIQNFFVLPTTWHSDAISFTLSGAALHGTWNTSNLTGMYTLRVTAIYEDDVIVEHIQNIILDTTLREGWPLHIPYEDTQGIMALGNTDIGVALPTANGQKIFAAADLHTWLASNPATQTLLESGIINPYTEDLDNDGEEEVLIYRAGDPATLTVYTNTGEEKWSFTTGTIFDGNLRPLTLADLTGNGEKEVLLVDPFTTTAFMKLIALRGDGTILWTTQFPHPNAFGVGYLTVADLDNDGIPEIIFKTPRKIFVFNHQGTLLHSWDIHSNSFCGIGCLDESASVGNFDEDPALELVVLGTEKDFTSGIFHVTIAVYDMDGTVLPGWPQTISGAQSFHAPAIGDVDGDGKQEILFAETRILLTGAQHTVHILKRDGTAFPGWPITTQQADGRSSPIFIDIENDGTLEIVGTYDTFPQPEIFVRDATGVMREGWPQQYRRGRTLFPDGLLVLAADITGNGILELLTASGNGFTPREETPRGGVYAWNAEGVVLDGFPRITDVDAVTAIVSDVDKNGHLDILSQSPFDRHVGVQEQPKDRSSVYIWNGDTRSSRHDSSWLTIGHDPQRTGCYDCAQEQRGEHVVPLDVRLREAVGTVHSLFTSQDLHGLATGSIELPLGETEYTQELRFGGPNLQAFGVNFAENDDDEVDTFLVLDETNPFFTWKLIFSPYLIGRFTENTVPDFVGITLTLMGKEYTITHAERTITGSNAGFTLHLLGEDNIPVVLSDPDVRTPAGGTLHVGGELIEDAIVSMRGKLGANRARLMSIAYALTMDVALGAAAYLPTGATIKSVLDEPQGMLGDWDISFTGITNPVTGQLALTASNDEYKLAFTNERSEHIANVPFVTNEDGVFKFGNEEENFVFTESAADVFTIFHGDVLVLSQDGVTSIVTYRNFNTGTQTLRFDNFATIDAIDVPIVDGTGTIIVAGRTFTVHIEDSTSSATAITVDLNGNGVWGDTVALHTLGGGRLALSPIEDNVLETTFHIGEEDNAEQVDVEIVPVLATRPLSMRSGDTFFLADSTIHVLEYDEYNRNDFTLFLHDVVTGSTSAVPINADNSGTLLLQGEQYTLVLDNRNVQFPAVSFAPAHDVGLVLNSNSIFLEDDVFVLGTGGSAAHLLEYTAYDNTDFTLEFRLNTGVSVIAPVLPDNTGTLILAGDIYAFSVDDRTSASPTITFTLASNQLSGDASRGTPDHFIDMHVAYTGPRAGTELWNEFVLIEDDNGIPDQALGMTDYGVLLDFFDPAGLHTPSELTLRIPREHVVSKINLAMP